MINNDQRGTNPVAGIVIICWTGISLTGDLKHQPILKVLYATNWSTGARCTSYTFNPLPDDKILNGSKLKQSADDNFKFDENSRKFSKRVENTVGKGEIAR